MPILKTLREFLDQEHVHYDVLAHRQAFTAQEVAEAQHIPGQEMAKVVIVHAGESFQMIVLPAPSRVDIGRARVVLGEPKLELATETQFARLFPHCEPGAMPPFGNLYSMPVWADRSLADDEEIVFNAGSHTQTVRMKYADFARLVAPKVASLAEED